MNYIYDGSFFGYISAVFDAYHAACDVLEKRGKIYEKEGALWLKSTEYGDDKDRVVIRDNGVPTYLAADIAYHKNKYDRGFKKLINIWGADHHGYVARVKAAIAALGYDPDQLEVLLLQMVSLFREGKPVKMSKRTGQAITLNELIEEVGTDAARYFFIMLECSDRLVTGVQICMKALGVKTAYIGVEDNKPEAVKVLKEAFTGIEGVSVEALPTKYPQGAEKMLIKAVTGREVEPGGLPMNVGCVVSNVGTVLAITDAVCHGIPFIERITTVTGDCIKEPKNLLVRIGTSYQACVDYCGGFSKQPDRVISGGPMMGLAQFSLDVPIAKGASGITCLSAEKCEVGEESPCIRCGRCVVACPMKNCTHKGGVKVVDHLAIVDPSICRECSSSCLLVKSSRGPDPF